MKGKAKRIASLLLVVMLMLGSTLVASASNSTTISRAKNIAATTTYSHTEVSVAKDTTDRGTATFKVKRSDDTFDMYRIVDITPGTVTGSSITSLSFSWVKPVDDFIKASNDFKNDADYATPEALGLFQYGEDRTANDQSKLIKLFKAIKADATTMAALKTGYTTVTAAVGETPAVTDPYYVAAINSTKVTALMAGTQATNTNANAVTYSKGSKTLEITTQGTAKTGEGATGLTDITAYTLANVPFGIYFVDVANAKRTDNGGYQPVVIDMVPEQTGPSGHWYMDNTRTFQVKNEGLKITKKINDKEEEQVSVGQIVTFKVEFQVPEYPKNTTDQSKYMFDWFSAFDASSKGFTLIPSSAVLTYYDKNNKEYHPHATLSADAYNNLTAKDSGGEVKYYDTNDSTTKTATLTAENTYTAYLLPVATPYVSSADTGTEKTVYFWMTPETAGKYSVWTQNKGQIVLVSSNYNGTIDASLITLINAKRATDEQIPTSYAANTFASQGFTQSLLGINFDYSKLMADTTYTANKADGKGKTSFKVNADTAEKTTELRSADFTHPDRVVITYDAIVNDQFEIGTDTNLNTAWLNYILDTNGDKERLPVTVKAWSYGAHLIKVDGEKYTTYESATDEQKTTLAANAGTNPFLADAKFDIYKFDTEYCGGQTATTSPTAADRTNYVFYNDVETPEMLGQDFASSVDTATRFATAKGKYATEGRLYKAIRYELTEKQTYRDPLTIGQVVGLAYSKLGNWNTAATFTNKYKFASIYTNVTALSTYNLLTDYMLPHVSYKANSTTTVDWKADADFAGSKSFVQYVAEEVDECDFAPGKKHYHLKAYVLVESDVTSNATADGIKVNGLGIGQYIMAESQAPDGYNKLDSQIYFEINKYGETEYTAAGSSYKGFLTDEFEHDDAEKTVKQDNEEDGYYPFIIKNYTGLTLPSTGGMGTLLFTIIGIIIMFAAIIFVIMKNRKIAKNATAFMMAALMVVGTLAGLLANTTTAEAAKIIIAQGDNGTSTGLVKATNGGKAEFTVWVNAKTDILQVYQIGTTDYSTTTGGWTEPQWVSKVKDLMLDNTNGFEAKTEYTCPTDPTLYSAADTEVQTAFLSWIYDTKDITLLDQFDTANVTVADTASANGRFKATIKNAPYGIYLVKAKSAQGKEYQALLLSAVPQERAPSGDWFVTGLLEAYLKYGDTQIVKKINGKDSDVVRGDETVNFTIVAEVPDYQAITYEKKDELGNLIADVITNKDSADYINYDWNKYYQYALTDVMSNAFKYDSATDTIKLEYTTDIKTHVTAEDIYAASDITWTEVPSTNNEYEMLFADEYDTTTKVGVKAFKASGDTTGKYFLMNSVVASSSFDCTWYMFDSKKGTITKLGTDNSVSNPNTLTPSNTIQAAYKTAAGLESTANIGTISVVTGFGDFKGITFDYKQLHRGYSTDATYEDKGANTVKYVKLTYTSKVTGNCLPGVETNTNTAYVWYRTNVSGDYDHQDDTVNAYTYGMNLVKVDGAATSATYLKDAKFELYKEAYIFVPKVGTQVDAPATTTYENFHFVKGADNDEYRDTLELRKDNTDKTLIGKITASGDPVTYDYSATATLKDFNDATGTQGAAGLQYYFRYVQVSLAGKADADAAAVTCSVDGCAVTNDTTSAVTHYHVHVYNQMALADQTSTDATETSGKHNDVTGNKICSTNTAAGVTIQGLEDASYVLIETTAPTGYNPLTEAMRFEIHTLTAEQKALPANSAFTTDKTFVSSTVVNDATGKTDVVTDTDDTMYQGYSNGIYGVTVKNYKGLTLPSTGGMGTLLFTIIGIVVMAVAMMVVVAKNKKRTSYM